MRIIYKGGRRDYKGGRRDYQRGGDGLAAARVVAVLHLAPRHAVAVEALVHAALLAQAVAIRVTGVALEVALGAACAARGADAVGRGLQASFSSGVQATFPSWRGPRAALNCSIPRR